MTPLSVQFYASGELVRPYTSERSLMSSSADLLPPTDIHVLARRVRLAFERGKLRSIAFGLFPRGACGDASEILGKILNDADHGSWSYCSGRDEEGGSHAWVRRDQDKLIVDLTADQFDQNDPVIVTFDHVWHQQYCFFPIVRQPMAFEGPALEVLLADYRTIRMRTHSWGSDIG